ncbi:hypothetical protein H2203_005213 [Taxawa tesnikishii (nom. ined.)]|nr:hypothetical protein H2203_005213 [Dothideales sp. JES 119]
MQPRPTQETAMSGYVGITDPRSYRLMNMRESLRHHPAHAVWLSYHAIVATSLPNSEPPGSFVGKTITVGGGSGRPHIETQSANGNGSSSKQQTERRREVETPTSINAETLADHVQDGSDSATTTLVRVATGFQEAIRESGFTKALSQEVAAAKESQKGLYHVGSGWTQPKQLRQQLRTV